MAARERDDTDGQDVLRRAGDASVLILTSLADGPKHGYALIQDIKGFAGLELGPGTLYGALDRLERLGLIAAPARRGPAASLPDHRAGSGGTARPPRLAGTGQRRRPAAAAHGRHLMAGPRPG